ncbi:HisS family protein [Mesorhizobium sp. dw_380]|uniref:histidine--tRNA ligase n=1 Tax=Mesorhizobium sp. dw_380 TaxID=2812001 RepID=UPI001BDEC1FE|nr:HisS family protein [Mesorhizobium sp. dw_380]
MADKSEKTKARLPRGFADRSAEDIRAVEKMMATIRSVYELYGFEPADQPLIEYTDALGKFLPDQDRPNEGVFSFQDDDDQWLSLRYDLTAPTARFVAENYERLPKPYRSYRSGWVFRNEKPGPGRFRQFMQFDADTIGTPNGVAGAAADAEMAMMMADVMEALGIKRGDYIVRVNNRKLFDGVLEAIGLGGDHNAGRRLTVLRAIDKLDKVGADGVRALLGLGRLDESGDFTKGAGLSDEQISCLEPILKFERNKDEISIAIASDDQKKPRFETIRRDDLGISGSASADALQRIEKFGWENASALGYLDSLFVQIENQFPEHAHIFATGGVGYEAYDELSKIAALAQAAGYGSDSVKVAINKVTIDLSVVRGLEYYTGPVFEAELLAEIPNEDGQIVRFGSVGGGGRYDGLVSRFRGEPVPATGFSIGVSRLMTALKNLGKLDSADVIAPVVVLVMDKDTESLGRYQKMVAQLRAAGIRSEMYLGGAGMKAQLKYADRRGCPVAIIQGGDERAKGELQIKDLIEGARMSAEITDNAEWRAARPAQVTVAEGELVAEVKKILAAQAADRVKGGASRPSDP